MPETKPMSPEITLGASEKVKMDQRTLWIILVAAASAAASYVDLKSGYKTDHEAITKLQDTVSADHDILIRLDQRTVWIASSKTGAISAGVGTAPESEAPRR
jgi:hypothetical protein